MNSHVGIFVALGLAMGFLAPVALAQKPAPPPSNPPPTSPTQPVNSISTPSQPGQPDADYVMFLTGKVATNDGSHLPTNVMVERICNAKVRQQIYADPSGEFSMQLGSPTDSTLDATADGTSQSVSPGKFAETGIPRGMLESCEVRTSASGFQSNDIMLAGLDTAGKRIEVGTIVLRRSTKVEGATLDAAAYKAPKDAVTAYQKGLEAQKNGKLDNARKYFEKAVEVYPAYGRAWFRLGNILEQEKQKEEARAAYTHATTVEAGFLPPYLSLAVMASREEKWNEVLHFTNFIVALDPFKDINGYTVELDPFNYAEAYFYNALANYQVKNFAEAERKALRAEHLLGRSPELHLLLGEIFVRKNDYPAAIEELQTYLDLVPHASNVEEVKARLAELKKRNDSSSGEKKDPA